MDGQDAIRKAGAAQGDSRPSPGAGDGGPLHPAGVPAPPRRSFRARMLGVGAFGWLRLALLCLAAGVVFEASGVNPFAPDFTWSGLASALATGAARILSWSITNGWRPLLVGAIVVGPVWLLWRAVVALFSR